ncbi:hypothetical protein NDU88_004731 [Pleurodeles waltl]|uniref:Uncharacterized protein n=1 Tax=Pleurodeles waltl TaxID=8319 RepID=A0AAV7QDC8_PLEWA|nr:hypothetical protein NDU88_004731 [Pleurodeles waltl]
MVLLSGEEEERLDGDNAEAEPCSCGGGAGLGLCHSTSGSGEGPSWHGAAACRKHQTLHQWAFCVAIAMPWCGIDMGKAEGKQSKMQFEKRRMTRLTSDKAGAPEGEERLQNIAGCYEEQTIVH